MAYAKTSEAIKDLESKSYEYWLKKNWYYHSFLDHFYQFVIPKGSKVLQVGCKTASRLAAVEPAFGVGIDDDANNIAMAIHKYPHYTFHVGTLKNIQLNEQFDYIILSSTTMEVYDIQELFESLHPYCHNRTRIVLDFYSALWNPTLSLLQKLGLRRPTPLQNWVSAYDMKNFLMLSGYDVVTSGKQMVLPVYIPIVSWMVNAFFQTVPLLDKLCLNQWFIARPITKMNPHDVTVSVVVPVKNERGNVEAAITRTPLMGKHTEFIFVEGHSHDGTLDEIKRVQAMYPEHDITCLVQDGKGKGDGMRKGFAHAKGDVLIILDGDLTTPPEEMPRFFNALVSGQGECINGSRLIYGMEDEAMRFLNLIANYLFGLGFSYVLGQRLKDTLCGTKVLLKTDYQKIVANRAFFGEFDPFGDFDLLFGAAKQNLKIIDLPVHYKARTYGVTQIRRFHAAMYLLRMSFVGFCKFKLRW